MFAFISPVFCCFCRVQARDLPFSYPLFSLLGKFKVDNFVLGRYGHCSALMYTVQLAFPVNGTSDQAHTKLCTGFPETGDITACTSSSLKTMSLSCLAHRLQVTCKLQVYQGELLQQRELTANMNLVFLFKSISWTLYEVIS